MKLRILGATIIQVMVLAVASSSCAGAQAAPGSPAPLSSKPQRVYPIQMDSPYSALRVVQHVTTFPDGSRKYEVSTTKLWRDSQGRERQDTTWQTFDGTIVTVCTIDDPVALVRYIWKMGTGRKIVVTETHYKMDGIVQRIWPNPPRPRIQPVPDAGIVLLTPQHAANTTGDQLPPQYIDGVYAEGTRDVEIIPNGQQGNYTGHPVKRIDEIWMSPDLGMPVKTYLDTGLGFTESLQLQNVSRSEPDPSVFRPPAGLPVRQAPESDPVWKEPIGCSDCAAP